MAQHTKFNTKIYIFKNGWDDTQQHEGRFTEKEDDGIQLLLVRDCMKKCGKKFRFEFKANRTLNVSVSKCGLTLFSGKGMTWV